MLPNTNLNDQHQPYQEAMNGDYTSLPCEAFSMATRTNSNSITNMDEFSHKNPVYQSAHVQVTSKPIVNNEESYNNIDNSEEGKAKNVEQKLTTLIRPPHRPPPKRTPHIYECTHEIHSNISIDLCFFSISILI